MVRASSSFHGAETVQYLVDGDSMSDRSRWISKGKEGAEWLELDLNEPREIGRVQLWFQTRGHAVRLLRDAGGGRWEPVADQTTTAALSPSLSFRPIRTQRLRIEFPGIADTVRVHEVGLYLE